MQIRHAVITSLFVGSTAFLTAQTVLQTQDIPSAGDTLVYSIAQLPVTVDPGDDGENKTWDFTNLNSGNQYVDRVSQVSGTNLVYMLYYGLPGNNFCNLAKTENNAPSLPEQTGIKFSDAYNFYRNTATGFVQKGFGASLNGIPIPVPYSSPEKIYAFPLNYNHRDTSEYAYEVEIPGIGYYGRQAHKTNHVDGWGTLKTSFGTFDALRIRSVLKASDTIALDTFGRGVRIPLPDEVKYKWVAKNHGMPLLEITATSFFGFEIPSRVVYRDFKKIDTGIEESQQSSISTSVYPNPASEILIIETELNRRDDLRFELYSSDGRLIHQIARKSLSPGKVIELIPLSTLNLHSGLYFVKISNGSGLISVRPCVVNNP